MSEDLCPNCSSRRYVRGVCGDCGYDTDDERSYYVRRFYADDTHPAHHSVQLRGATLAEAQAWCQDPATSHRDPQTGEVVWFDGYDQEHA